MQRQAIALAELAERKNLELATWKAARGKSSRPAVARFLDQLDENLDRLAVDIVSGNAPLGRAIEFTIHDPKRRTIHAACFADRVLHHAIFNLAEARLERMLVDSCYACRLGKGVHSAVVAVQQTLRAYPWFAQVDIDAYFPSIRHDLLLELLARRFKGAPFLRLLARILACGAPGGSGVGLPIGALTSQSVRGQEASLRLPQMEAPRQPQRQPGVSLCPELAGANGMDLPATMDQTRRPAATGCRSGEPQGARSAGRRERRIPKPTALRVAASAGGCVAR